MPSMGVGEGVEGGGTRHRLPGQAPPIPGPGKNLFFSGLLWPFFLRIVQFVRFWIFLYKPFWFSGRKVFFFFSQGFGSPFFLAFCLLHRFFGLSL